MAKHLTCALLLALAFMRRPKSHEMSGLRAIKRDTHSRCRDHHTFFVQPCVQSSTSCEAFQARHVLVKDLAKAAQVSPIICSADDLPQHEAWPSVSVFSVAGHAHVC